MLSFQHSTRPSFDSDFSSSPSSSGPFHSMPSGFDRMDSRKTSAPPPSTNHHSESIPIKVIHEQGPNKHKYQPNMSRTADLPSAKQPSSESPRVTRAASEPPKNFNQRLLKTKIPLGNVSEQNEHNLATSASDSSVPSSEQQQTKSDNQQGQASGEPTVRHIPIRVEGRDEPVLNKPSSLKVNKKKIMDQEPTSPLSPIPSDQPIPMGYSTVDNGQASSSVASNDKESSPQPLPSNSAPIPLPCSQDYMKPSQKVEEEKKLPIDDPCLAQLAKIMDNVLELSSKIETFKGDKNSKDYRYLDEMLTRNLLALDGIETAGREDIRQQRKESIKSINRCLSILESKAKGQCQSQAETNNEILSELAAKK